MSDQMSWEALFSSVHAFAAGKSPNAKSEEAAIAPVLPKPERKQDVDIQKRIAALMEKKSQTIESVTTVTATTTTVVSANPLDLPSAPSSKNTASEKLDEKSSAAPAPDVLTVTGLNSQVKQLLEGKFPLVWVKGEISNFKVPASGHFYFTLKDANSQVRAIMFRGFNQQLKFRPEDGMEVLVRCKVTAYEARGDYQLFCEVMEPVGFGALQIAFEKLKTKLAAEGLFDHKRKRALPTFPTRIAIITSPTGAAIRDMLNVLSRRYGGGLDISILPASVQGAKAAGEIVAAIELVNRLGPERFDVLIVGRGGGSLEDLWSFNIEEVVRAVAHSKIPTISAVGHEVDFTICDFVADLRAPTPSAAAELVVKNKKDLSDRIASLQRHVVNSTEKHLHVAQTHLTQMSKRLIDPKRKLQDLMLRCDELSERVTMSAQRFIEALRTQIHFLRERLGSPEQRLRYAEQKLQHTQHRLHLRLEKIMDAKHAHFIKLTTMLNGLSPLSILDRGYSLARLNGAILKNANQAKPGDPLRITLHQGEIEAEVVRVFEKSWEDRS